MKKEAQNHTLSSSIKPEGDISDTSNTFSRELEDAKFTMRKLKNDYPQCEHLVELLFAFLEKDGLKIEENFELLCKKTLDMNEYMRQLIGNVMFQKEGYKNDRFHMEKNSRLCSSLIFYYSQQELVPITLKDIQHLQRCKCDPQTVIERDGVCRNCHKLNQKELYADKNLKKEILKVKISENSKILVYMLEILSNLQKRNTTNIVKSIQKTFLESYDSKSFDKIQPIFELINFIIFSLIDKFDPSMLVKIFKRLMKKSMMVDQDQTEMLMLYLVRDDILMCSEIGDNYDSLGIQNLLKRQICFINDNSIQKKTLVRYLTLASTFYSKQTSIN
jgi:hypothetical protein